MKLSMKKLSAVMVTMIMTVSLLGACGGSSGGSEESAEPNAGIRGIVLAMPDGWNVVSGSENYVEFENADSKYHMSLSATNNEDLENLKKYDTDVTASDIQEYFNANIEQEKKNLKKNNAEVSDVKVCGTDGYYFKSKNDKGFVNMSTEWLYEDNSYYFGILYPGGYDYENEKFKEDIEPLTDDEIAMYEAVVASVKAGDGASYFKKVLDIDSINSYTFELPEGFNVDNFGENYLGAKAEDGEVTLIVNATTNDDLQYLEDENGNHPESLKEWWGNQMKWIEDSEKLEIAGHEGFLNEYPDENGKIYNVSASFYDDEYIYNMNMDTDAWDENGNIKADAKELTKDEIAAFEAFVKSFKAK